MKPPEPLSEAENERIFREVILKDFNAKLVPSSRPTVAFVGGQSAAGKSTLIGRVEDELAKQGPAVLVQRDELRNFYPGYKDQLKAFGSKGAEFSEQDSWKWYSKLIEEAKRVKASIVIESTLRKTDDVVSEIKKFKAAGYRVEVNALGVHPEKSLVSVFERYENEIARTGAGRFVEPKLHHEAVSGLRKTIKAVESQRLVDQIKIISRSGRELGTSQPIREQSTQAFSALEKAHLEQLSLEKKKELMGRLKAVEDKQVARGAQTNELKVTRQEISLQKAKYLNPKEAEQKQQEQSVQADPSRNIEGAHPARISRELALWEAQTKELLEAAKTPQDKVAAIAFSHARRERIHPVKDENVRTGQAIMNHQLIVAFGDRDRSLLDGREYIEALKAASHGNLTDLVKVLGKREGIAIPENVQYLSPYRLAPLAPDKKEYSLKQEMQASKMSQSVTNNMQKVGLSTAKTKTQKKDQGLDLSR